MLIVSSELYEGFLNFNKEKLQNFKKEYNIEYNEAEAAIDNEGYPTTSFNQFMINDIKINNETYNNPVLPGEKCYLSGSNYLEPSDGDNFEYYFNRSIRIISTFLNFINNNYDNHIFKNDLDLSNLIDKISLNDILDLMIKDEVLIIKNIIEKIENVKDKETVINAWNNRILVTNDEILFIPLELKNKIVSYNFDYDNTKEYLINKIETNNEIPNELSFEDLNGNTYEEKKYSNSYNDLEYRYKQIKKITELTYDENTGEVKFIKDIEDIKLLYKKYIINYFLMIYNFPKQIKNNEEILNKIITNENIKNLLDKQEELFEKYNKEEIEELFDKLNKNIMEIFDIKEELITGSKEKLTKEINNEEETNENKKELSESTKQDKTENYIKNFNELIENFKEIFDIKTYEIAEKSKQKISKKDLIESIKNLPENTIEHIVQNHIDTTEIGSKINVKDIKELKKIIIKQLNLLPEVIEGRGLTLFIDNIGKDSIISKEEIEKDDKYKNNTKGIISEGGRSNINGIIGEPRDTNKLQIVFDKIEDKIIIRTIFPGTYTPRFPVSKFYNDFKDLVKKNQELLKNPNIEELQELLKNENFNNLFSTKITKGNIISINKKILKFIKEVNKKYKKDLENNPNSEWDNLYFIVAENTSFKEENNINIDKLIEDIDNYYKIKENIEEQEKISQELPNTHSLTGITNKEYSEKQLKSNNKQSNKKILEILNEAKEEIEMFGRVQKDIFKYIEEQLNDKNLIKILKSKQGLSNEDKFDFYYKTINEYYTYSNMDNSFDFN